MLHVADAEPFLVAAAKAMEIDTLHQIDTGLDPVTAEREQWDDGNNTLALAPRVAVAYERNDETNDRLEDAGIEVVRIAGSELGSGRGGPRCMSCPISREPLPVRLSRARPGDGPRLRCAPGWTSDTRRGRAARIRARHAAHRLRKAGMADSFFDAFTPQEVARISAAGTRVTLPAGLVADLRRGPPPTRPTSSSSGTVSVRKGEEVAQLGAGRHRRRGRDRQPLAAHGHRSSR